MRGGTRKNAGAKPKPATRKHPFNCRLPQYLIAWLKAQNTSQAVLIEDALVEKHNLESFKKEWFKVSEFPSNFIPAGAKEFTVTDERDGTVKGFYTDSGDIHIQEIIAAPNQ